MTALFAYLSSFTEQAYSAQNERTQRDLDIACSFLLDSNQSKITYREALNTAIKMVNSQPNNTELKVNIKKYITPYLKPFANKVSLEEYVTESGSFCRTSYEAFKRTAQEFLENLKTQILPFDISTKSKTFLKSQKKARTESEMLLYDLRYALFDIIGWYAGSLVRD